MDVRAAVAHKAGAPLTIENVQLQGPKVGEVLVEIKATGICHTDALGRRPRRLIPRDPGPRGGRRGGRCGAGRHQLEKG